MEDRSPEIHSDSSLATRRWTLARNFLRAVKWFREPIAIETPLEEVLIGIKAIPTDKHYREEKVREAENSTFVRALRDYKRQERIFVCIEKGGPQDIEELEFLLNSDPYKYLTPNCSGCLYNQRGKNEQTPLYVACKNGNLPIVEKLLANEADPYLTSHAGHAEETCLEVAVRWNYLQVVKLLVDRVQWDQKVLRKAYKLARGANMGKILKRQLKSTGCACIAIKNSST